MRKYFWKEILEKDSLPSEIQLRNARKQFETLLSRRTTENEWQEFFTANPYVLSLGLPLRLEPREIVPFARAGKPDPDFIFYPNSFSPIPFYGTIELKKPESKIITITRSNVAILTRDAETAIEQAKSYTERLARVLVKRKDRTFWLGNESYMFIIMGRTTELSSKLGNDVFQEMIDKKLPKNLQILPYDYLLKRFESHIPPKLYILVPKRQLYVLFDEQGHDDQNLGNYLSEREVQEVINTLAPKLREAIILRDIQDLKYEEISKIIRIPIGTVKSRINRGRRQVQHAMQLKLTEGKGLSQ